MQKNFRPCFVIYGFSDAMKIKIQENFNGYRLLTNIKIFLSHVPFHLPIPFLCIYSSLGEFLYFYIFDEDSPKKPKETKLSLM